MEKDQQFVEDVVKAIVDLPEKVTTERSIDEMGVLIKLTVDPSDMGKVIGKGGKIIKAIRNIMKIKAIKDQKRIMVNLVDHAN